MASVFIEYWKKTREATAKPLYDKRDCALGETIRVSLEAGLLKMEVYDGESKLKDACVWFYTGEDLARHLEDNGFTYIGDKAIP